MQSAAAPHHSIPEIAAAAAGYIALVLLRPTMVAFALAVVAVAIVLIRRSRATVRQWLRAAALVGVVGLFGALAQIVRDYVLSGWLAYPLSLLPFDVGWRAGDPVYLRTATLGYHRDADDLWQAAEGWGWVGPWLGRLPQRWEFWFLVLLIAGCAVALVMALRWGSTLRTRAMLLAMTPSAVMVVVWWLATPPSFRFAWGPAFTLATIPLGWFIWRTVRGRAPRRRRLWATWIAWLAVVPVAVVVGFSLVARLDWDSMTSSREWRAGVTIPYAVSPAPVPMTNAVELADGLRIQVPVDGSACWAAPLPCTSELDGRIRLMDPLQGLPGGLAVSHAE